jgi:hypothetical protein
MDLPIFRLHALCLRPMLILSAVAMFIPDLVMLDTKQQQGMRGLSYLILVLVGIGALSGQVPPPLVLGHS